MRGGYRVYAVEIDQHWHDGKTRVAKVRNWFEAASPCNSKLHTTCGHKHKTIEGAEKCVPAVELAYREKRWPGSTKKARAW
jgi:hypothetical protein